MAEQKPPKPSPNPNPKGYNLTRTQEAFLLQLVKDGRAYNKPEALRGLIWQEMKRWAKENGRTFPSQQDTGEGGAGEGESESVPGREG